MKNITEAEALSKAAAYCSTTEHCRSEIYDKLHRWGMSGSAINRILQHLEDEKYIDEERFCRAFIRDKYRLAKWGKVKISQALQHKKIPYSAFRSLLDEVDEEEYLSILSNLLADKRRSTKADNQYQLDGKLIRFALSRGFEMKDIRRCMDVSDENDMLE